MGWDGMKGTKEDAVKDVLRKWECTEDDHGIVSATRQVMAHHVTKNCLWMIESVNRSVATEHQDAGLYITLVCHVIEEGTGKDEGWVYVKSIPADMQPFYYCCPLSLVRRFEGIADDEDKERQRPWLTAYHKGRTAKKARGQMILALKDRVDRGEEPVVTLDDKEGEWALTGHLSQQTVAAQAVDAVVPLALKVSWTKVKEVVS